MSGDGPRDHQSIQIELNRQALVELGKRLSGLEDQLASIEEGIADLNRVNLNTLESAKRLQSRVRYIVDWINAKEQKKEDGGEG